MIESPTQDAAAVGFSASRSMSRLLQMYSRTASPTQELIPFAIPAGLCSFGYGEWGVLAILRPPNERLMLYFGVYLILFWAARGWVFTLLRLFRIGLLRGDTPDLPTAAEGMSEASFVAAVLSTPAALTRSSQLAMRKNFAAALCLSALSCFILGLWSRLNGGGEPAPLVTTAFFGLATVTIFLVAIVEEARTESEAALFTEVLISQMSQQARN